MNALTILDHENDVLFSDTFWGMLYVVDDIEYFVDSFRDTCIADLSMNLPLITEQEKEVSVKLEIPGINKNDLDICLEGSRLTVRTKERKNRIKKETENNGSNQYYYSVTLPSPVDGEKVVSSFKNGLLELHFPKVIVEPKKIEITRKTTIVDKKDK